ncbi:MAG: hypothetical protein K1X56_08915 [Flavobacteriales bacterium]|nr:hypothetical protein [Flavobacteriales bacterium]
MENNFNQQDPIPDDILAEARSMAGWMNFVAIMTFIGQGLSILGNISNLATQGGIHYVLQILVGGFSIYIAILLVKKVSLFRQFGHTGDLQVLNEAMIQTKMYWTLTLVMLGVSILIGIVFPA